MAKQNRNILKSYFEQGDIPTEGQYADLIDSTAILNSENTGSLDVKGDMIAERFIGNGSLITGITASLVNISGITSSITGSLLISGNLFYTSGSSNVLLGIRTTGSILPGGNNIWDLGSPTQYFRELYSNTILTTNIIGSTITIDHITASGNISSSNNITANNFTGIFDGALSSSAQIATNISGAFTATSASFSTSVTTNINTINTKSSITQLNASSSALQTNIDAKASITQLNVSSSALQTNLNTSSSALQTNIDAKASIIQLNASSSALQTNLNTSSSALQTNIDTKASIAQLNTSSSALQINLNTSSSALQTNIDEKASITQLNVSSSTLQGNIDEKASITQLNVSSSALQTNLNTSSSVLQTNIDEKASITQLNVSSSTLQGNINEKASITQLNVSSSALQTNLNTSSSALQANLNTSSSVLQTNIDEKSSITQLNVSSSALQANIDVKASITQLNTSSSALQTNLNTSSSALQTNIDTKASIAQLNTSSSALILSTSESINSATSSLSASLATSIASNAANTFKTTGQRSGNSFITGSLHLTGSTSDLRVDGTVGIGTAAPTANNIMLHVKSNYTGLPTVIIEGDDGGSNANLEFKNTDISWVTGLTGGSYSDSFLIRSSSANALYPFAIDPSAGGTATHPLLYLESNKVSILGHINANPDANLLVSGNLFISGPNGHITASGNISASGTITANSFKNPNIKIQGNAITNIVNQDVFFQFGVNGIGFEAANSNLIAFNSNQNNVDLHFSGTGDQELFYIDASEDKIGIGTNTPGEKLEVIGNISASGTGSFGYIETSGLFNRTNDDNTGFEFSSDTVVIQGNGVHAALFSSTLNRFIVPTEIQAHLTASGNISASGDIYGADFYVDGHKALNYHPSSDSILLGETNQPLNVQSPTTFSQPVTASGNVSSSGTIVGSNLSGTNTGDQNLDNLAITGSNVIFGNITASGNISASALVEGIGFRTTGNSGFGGQVHVGGTTVSSFNTGQIFKATGTSEFTGDITGSSRLLIQKSSGEGTPSAGTSDVAIFQNNTSGQDASIAIIAADENSSQIHFGRYNSIKEGSIRYFHSSSTSHPDTLQFRIGNTPNVIGFAKDAGNRGMIGVGDASRTPTDFFHAQGGLSGGGLTVSSSNGGTILLKAANTRAILDRTATDKKLNIEFNTAGTTNWTLGNISESNDNFYIYSGDGQTDKHISLTSDSTTFHTNITASNNISASGNIYSTNITAVSGAFSYITASIIDVDANTIRLGGSPFSKTDVDSLKEGKMPEQTPREGFTNRLQPEAIFGKHDSDYIKFTIGNRIGTIISGTIFHDMNLTGSNNYFAVGKDNNTQLRLTGQITASSHISASGTLTANKGVFGIDDSEQPRVIINPTGQITASSHISASGNITAAVGIFGTGTTTINDNISSSGTLSSSGIFVAGNVSAVSMSGDGSGLTNLSATVPTGTISSSLQTFTNITASGNISASGTIITSNFSGTTSGTNTGDQNLDNLAITGSNVIFGNITSSNNISSSGTVTAAAGTFGTGTTTINDNINTTGNITASGNIKAGGNISASGDILGNTIITNNIVFYSGSTSIKIEAPDEVSNTAGSHLTLEAGNGFGHDFDGGDLILNAGKGSGAGVGGDITLNTFGVVAGAMPANSGSFTLNSKNFSVSTTGNVTSSGAISASGKLTAISLNTGQGDYELYNMNQNVTTTSDVTFNNITASINLKVNGDTTLGNQESDTHTFTGNITASGDISSSGNIISSNSSIIGRQYFGGSGGSNIHFVKAGNNLALNNGGLTTSEITASGNISASHASTASFGSMKLTNLPTTKPTTTGSLWLSGSNAEGTSKYLMVFTG